MVRKRIVAAGLGQCVGFRWFAGQNAARLGLTGWVCNREDGTVEMEVQGAAEAVDAFIGAAARGPRYAEVTHIEVEGRKPDPDERSFHVRGA